jgi:hypothetical protein
MKKVQTMFLMLLSAFIVLAAAQSAEAFGKASLDLAGIADPTLPGTKYDGMLTIHYETLPAGTLVNGLPCPPNDAPSKMHFFVKLNRGNDVFFFSYEGTVTFCALRDEGPQQAEANAFFTALGNHLFSSASTVGVKAIQEFIDATGVFGGQVIGIDQTGGPSDLPWQWWSSISKNKTIKRGSAQAIASASPHEYEIASWMTLDKDAVKQSLWNLLYRLRASYVIRQP